MKFVFGSIAAFAGLVYWMLFGSTQAHDLELARFSMDGVPALVVENDAVHASFDVQHTADGDGALRIETDGPALIDLVRFDGRGENLSFRQLRYHAKLRTEDAQGPVRLVMQAGIAPVAMPVLGNESVTGSQEWTELSAWAGNPDGTYHAFTTTLQLEVGGAGTVWVDDLRVVSRQHL